MAGGMGGYGGPNVPPMQPMQQMPPPVREKRSGANGCLIGGLAGCGILLILIVVGGMIGMKSLKNSKGGGIGKMMANISTAQEYAPKLVKVGAALDRYRDDHGGKYPASLNALVPKYMPDKSAFTAKTSETVIEYTPPRPNASPDAIVLSVTNGEIQILTSHSTIYYRLLKDGRIVQDQLQRVDVSNKYNGK